MDGNQFDLLTRRLMADRGRSRRVALRAIAGVAFGGLLARVAPAAAQETAAPGDLAAAAKPGGKDCLTAGQKCSAKDGRRCCGGSRCAGGRCRCKPGTRVCEQRCLAKDRCCRPGDCPDGQECRAGRCRCADGTKACGDVCIDVDRCCADDDCRGDETCQEGSCRCPAGTKECGGNRCLDPEVCCEEGNCRCPDDLRACGDRCIPRDACCDDRDCPDGRACQDGTCRCPDGSTEVDGRCADTCEIFGTECDPDLCACRGVKGGAGGAGVCVVNNVAPLPEDDFCDLQRCQSSAQCRADEVCITTLCGAPDAFEGRCARICPGTGTAARRRAARHRRR